VVEGARLESEAGQRCRAILQRVNAYAINDLTFQAYHSVCVAKPRCSTRFWIRRITVLSQSSLHLGRRLVAAAHHASNPADPRLLTPAYLIDQRLSQLGVRFPTMTAWPAASSRAAMRCPIAEPEDRNAGMVGVVAHLHGSVRAHAVLSRYQNAKRRSRQP
jgi:hypothetical protein